MGAGLMLVTNYIYPEHILEARPRMAIVADDSHVEYVFPTTMSDPSHAADFAARAKGFAEDDEMLLPTDWVAWLQLGSWNINHCEILGPMPTANLEAAIAAAVDFLSDTETAPKPTVTAKNTKPPDDGVEKEPLDD